METRLRTASAAAYLTTPPATLSYWRSKGVGPRWYKLGKHVLYDIEDLDAFVEKQKQKQKAAS